MNSNGSSQKLEGRKTIITGGSRGIGAAIAKAFVAEGASVAFLHYEDNANAEQTLADLRTVNAACLALECDVSSPEQVQTSVDTVLRHFKGVDILVNCAATGVLCRFELAKVEDWNRILSVNLTGAFLMSRHCYPVMIERKWGRIINISSQWAFSGGIEAAAYVASKAGLIGLTRSVALEGAQHGVLVNCIAPGATDTNSLRACPAELLSNVLRKIPVGRFGKPEEIAATAVFLASDAGAYFVGQTISPNGGDVLH